MIGLFNKLDLVYIIMKFSRLQKILHTDIIQDIWRLQIFNAWQTTKFVPQLVSIAVSSFKLLTN